MSDERATGTTADGDRPGAGLGQLVDLLVYAPIGVLTKLGELTKDVPDLVATGRQRLQGQFTMARFIGQMAVRQVSSEVGRRLEDKERAGDVVAPAVADVAPDVGGPDSLPEALIAAVEQEIVEDEVQAVVASTPVRHVPSADELPIDGYESLAASQVVVRLGSLNAAELAAIEQYESAHRGRRTILGKIHQLQAR